MRRPRKKPIRVNLSLAREHYWKATPEYIELLLETVDKEPLGLGYEFARWTAERLATYLTE